MPETENTEQTPLTDAEMALVTRWCGPLPAEERSDSGAQEVLSLVPRLLADVERLRAALRAALRAIGRLVRNVLQFCEDERCDTAAA